MALIDIWTASPSQLEDKHVQQIIAFAGFGKLLDGSAASVEFREFLSRIPSSFLERYADECLSGKFDGSGFALQDVINQVGRRAGFVVRDGRYRGTTAHIGFDGLWRSDDGHTIVAEIKTTDAYRIDLNVITGYRRALIRSGEAIEDQSSILIIVGREDTGDLEAQIRGSRHAWDIRLISVDALLRLMRLKEGVEDPATVRKIRDILVPREYTKVDQIIELVFSAAEEVQREEDEQPAEVTAAAPDQEPKSQPMGFHDACVQKVRAQLGRSLIRQSRTMYSSADGKLVLVCSVSREHNKSGTRTYWFGFHPYQKDVLEQAAESYLAFGCGSADTVFLVPYDDFRPWMEGMNVTKTPDRSYWHVSIYQDKDGPMLHRRKGHKRIPLIQYLLNHRRDDRT